MVMTAFSLFFTTAAMMFFAFLMILAAAMMAFFMFVMMATAAFTIMVMMWKFNDNVISFSKEGDILKRKLVVFGNGNIQCVEADDWLILYFILSCKFNMDGRFIPFIDERYDNKVHMVVLQHFGEQLDSFFGNFHICDPFMVK